MPKFAIKVPNGDLITVEAEDIAYDEYNLELTTGDRVVAYFREWAYVYELVEPGASAVPVEEADLGDVVRSGLDSR